MPGVVVSGRPTNLHLPEHVREVSVDGDLFRICDRLLELDPNLHVNLFEDTRTGKFRWVIFERGRSANGEDFEHALFRVEELDNRVIDRLRRVMNVPLNERVEAALKEQDEYEREQHEETLERLYEEVGRHMWMRFEKDGFIESRPVSYPKSGHVGGRGSMRGIVGGRK